VLVFVNDDVMAKFIVGLVAMIIFKVITMVVIIAMHSLKSCQLFFMCVYMNLKTVVLESYKLRRDP